MGGGWPIISRGLLIAVAVVLLALGCAGGASAKGGRDLGEKADALRDRFTQRDTADFINRYSYAENDPINNQDPSGH